MEGESARPDRLGRDQKLALIGIAVLLLGGGIVALLLTAFSGGSSGESRKSAPVADVAYPNVDPSNSRRSGGAIDASTVSRLEVAWNLPLEAQGTFGSAWTTPVIADGVVYLQDAASNVRALELANGRVLWERQYNSPAPGPNGVVVAGPRVYGSTAADAFALDRESGEELWSADLTGHGEAIEMGPGYSDGLVFVSTIPSALRGGEVGTLWALDAETGKKAWSFATVPKDLWGHPELNYGGGLWQTPAFDEEGSIYFGVANPGPLAGTNRYPWGKSRPGPNLYTNSIVKLNAKGKLVWHYQLTPHALCDWDLQGPPMLIEAGGRELVVIAGKAGIVIALDRDSGELIWKRSVGIHNGHDNDGVEAMKGDYSNLSIPQTVYPGTLGGVMSPSSTDGSRIFVPVVNHPTTLVAQGKSNEDGPRTGELVAIDAASGSVAWKHKFNSPAIGATSVVNELVFATTQDGTLYAFDGDSGEQVWETSLPAGIIGGLGFSEEMMVAPAGTITAREQTPQLIAYRLGV